MENVQAIRDYYKQHQQPYIDWNEKNQKTFNDLPIHFAFGDKQIKEEFESMGLDPDRDMDKVVGIGAGGFILKSDYDYVINFMNDKTRGIDYFKKNYSVDDFKGAIWYELWNHEFMYNNQLNFDMNEVFNFTPEEKKIYKEVLQDLYKYYSNTEDEELEF